MMSKILLIGGTGYIGKFIVEASAKAGHPTFLLIRESTLSNPTKSSIINKFKDLSVNFVLGDLYDHQSLVKAIKQVDVVICTVARSHLSDQDKIISAIKEAGNVKLNQQRVHTPLKPEFGAALRQKEFHTLTCQVTTLLVTSYPLCHSMELQLHQEIKLLS